MRKFVFVALVCLLAASPALAQGVKGTLSGVVVDEGGVALPGVTVTLTSPALPAGESAVTDTTGSFRFVRLNPGQYKAVFGLSGYQRLEHEGIQVNIAEDVRLDVTLRSAFTEEVVVSSESPLVDTTTNNVGVDLNQEFFLDLPTGRNYTSVAAVTPGAQGDRWGQTFYGSTSAENAYYIDGVNTTGVEFSEQGKTLNFEFIQEVQVRTGGYSAENGRSTGGSLNVITKSGGNEFHGDVFGYYDNDSLQANLKGAAIRGALSGSFNRTGYTREDFGADLGGFLVKDKLWFFAAYDRVNNTDTLAALQDFSSVVVDGPYLGEEYPSKRTSDLYAGKLTWRITGNQSLAVAVFGDPNTNTGVLPNDNYNVAFTLAAAPTEFTGTYKQGGTDYNVNYDGVFGQNFVLSARGSQHNEKGIQSGPGMDLPGLVDMTNPLGNGTTPAGWDDLISGFTYVQNSNLRREQYNLDGSLFVENFGGQHEFKVGAEKENISGNVDRFMGGTGQRIYRFACNPAVRYCGEPGQEQPYYYRHRFYVASTDVPPADLTQADVLDPLGTTIKADNYAGFFQDRWQVNPRFTFNWGVRWEEQKLYNHLGAVNADIKDEWQPRLGFVWDWAGNGKSKLYGHWGRFYETIPMDMVIRSFGGEISLFSYNLSENPADVYEDPRVRASRYLGGTIEPADPNLKGQFIEEFVLGNEYEVSTDLSVGIKLIRRDLARVIEDALAADGNYYIGNPGYGYLSSTYDVGYAYGIACPDGTMDCHLHAAPKAHRTFTGVELTAQKRFSNNFQFIASAVYGRLYGNYDGTFQVSTGQLDPNINSAYDYYDFSINNQGYLSNDRRQQYKLDGIYRFDWGLTVGLTSYYMTGTPITAYGYSTAYSNWEYYLSRRGAFGRTDKQFEADLHLGYPIKLGGSLEVNILVDVFNLFNRQGETSRNQRYDNVEDYYVIDWNTGLPNPAITPGSLTSPPTDTSFNTANAWQPPREIRAGVRLSF